MKKSTPLLAFLILACFTVFCPNTPAAEAAREPAEAVALLMEDIKSWDAQAAMAVLDGAVPQPYMRSVGEIFLPTVLSRLDYRLGNAKSSGRSAAVDIDITAADIKELAGEIVAEAVGCAAISRLTGIPLDIEAYITGRIEKAMEDGSLTTIKTSSTVYLILGADGAWKLDMTDIRNLGFLEALTGGMASFEEPLRSVFEGMADRDGQ